MLFERQRVLLTLLDAIGEPVAHTDFQKLLFLFAKEWQETPSYEFVPYRFGGFSFTSYADKRKLIAKGLLAEDEHKWILTAEGRKTIRQRAVEPLLAARFARKHSSLRGNALIAEQYQRYPYYATRSEIAGNIGLSRQALEMIEESTPTRKPAGLVTIGYEGRGLYSYLNALLGDGVTVLCDVRRNPLSRKYGFSKSTLSHACEGVDIRYRHLPELGIESEKRRELKTQADYDQLFDEYKRDSLPHQGEALATIQAWIDAGDRVALTCFEQQPCQCHRHCVAEALERASNNGLIAGHL